MTTRLSLARQRVQGEEGAAAAAAEAPFARNLAVLGPAAAAAWLALWAAQWRYGDAERLRALEDKPLGAALLDILGSRLAAHLGPYQLPNFARARSHERHLRQLHEPLLLDHERARALTRLGLLSHRRAAVPALLAGDGGQEPPSLDRLAPVLRIAFGLDQDPAAAELSSTQSHQAAAVRVVLDAVFAVPAEGRIVPAWVLSGLLQARGPPWTDGPQGEELRALVLLQLLRVPENCVTAASLPEVLEYVQQPGFKAKGNTFLPIRAYLTSGETPDLLRRCARRIGKECPGQVAVQQRLPRDTPTLQTKHDIRNLWTTALLTCAWAGFRAWRGRLDMPAALALARACGGALAGMGVLEGLWRAEERLIESPWYFEGGSGPLASSAAMALTNATAAAWALRFSVGVPFLACRLVKDDFLDAYRTFGA